MSFKAIQMATIVFVVAAYLIGSLSFAVIVSRLFALPDPHSYGSGNPGATNVLRTGKKLAAALTLAGDCGKGAPTALGILCAINLWLGLATLASWLVIVLFFRMVSLASIIAAVFAPFYTAWLFGTASPLLPAVLAIAALLIYRHKENIRRLLAGQENRIGAKKQDPA